MYNLICISSHTTGAGKKETEEEKREKQKLKKGNESENGSFDESDE